MTVLRVGRAPTIGARCGGSASNRSVSGSAIAAFGRSGDVFVGGVLNTLSAWVIGFASSWLALMPRRKLRASPRQVMLDPTRIECRGQSGFQTGVAAHAATVRYLP